MYGKGLIKGLLVSAKRFMSKKVTQKYPEVEPDLPPRSRGSFQFEADKCIACNMCADACPNGVIRVDFTKDPKGKRTLEKYNMNLGYCLFCGLCVSACPKDAINFSKDFHLACYNEEDTLYCWDKPASEEQTEGLDEVAVTKDTEPKSSQEV